ncbi:MAG: nucleotidyltransferase family protein [Anaerolineales bacterium]
MLLCCARTRIGKGTTQRIRALAAGELDWERLRSQAKHHRVLPLLYRALYNTCIDHVPEETMAGLRLDYQVNAAHSLGMARELLSVLSLLEERGIRAMPIKGPLLGETAYGDLALRQYDDLDILVSHEDVPAAYKLLSKHAFQPGLLGRRSVQQAFPCGYRQLGLRAPWSNIELDLHWEVLPGDLLHRIDLEGFWRRGLMTAFCGVRVHALSHEDTLLLLVMHGMRHAWARLGWICDLAESLRAWNDVDWEGLIALVESAGAGKVLAVGLHLVRKLLDPPLPELAAAFAHRYKHAEKMAAVLFGDICDPSDAPSPLRTGLLNLSTRQGLRGKLGYLKAHALAPNWMDWIWLPLPRGLTFLYAFLRPLRLLTWYVLPIAIRRVARAAPAMADVGAQSGSGLDPGC